MLLARSMLVTPQPQSEQPVVDTPAKPSPPKPRAFTPPTVDEVRAYVAELKANVDADRFVDFYASKGWMVGKNQMRDWKAAVRTWARRRWIDSNRNSCFRRWYVVGPGKPALVSSSENANNFLQPLPDSCSAGEEFAGDGGADHAEAETAAFTERELEGWHCVLKRFPA